MKEEIKQEIVTPEKQIEAILLEKVKEADVVLRTQEKARIFANEDYLLKMLGRDKFMEVAGEVISVLDRYGVICSPATTEALMGYIADTVKYSFLVFSSKECKE